MYNRDWMSEKRSKTPPSFFLIMLLAALVLWLISSCIGANQYNGGICRQCGGRYVFRNAVGRRWTTEYVYVCDKCGSMIEINTYYPPEEPEDEGQGNEEALQAEPVVDR